MATTDAAHPFTRADLLLYERLLFEIHGPHGREIQLDIGPTAQDLYDAIVARARAIVREGSDDLWTPDEIDLAAIRVVSRSILHRHYEPEFRTVTGYNFEQVEALLAKAEALVRRRRWGAGRYTIEVGRRRFQFPSRIIRDARHVTRQLIAVPSPRSWPLVYRRRDEGGREEALAVLRDHPYPGDHVEEFEAESYWELEQEATRRARELSSWSLLEHGLVLGEPKDSTQR